MNALIKKAFTLIELLVVIAIIGILSGLIVVSMSGITQKATIAKAQVFSNSLRSSLMTNMVSDWNFDGSGVSDGSSATSAYLQDIWGQKNGTVTATPPTVLSGNSCVSGSCLNFNGSQYVSVPYNSVFNFGTAMTAMVWAKGMGQNGNTILGRYDYGNLTRSWAIASTSQNKLKIVLSGDGLTNTKEYYSNVNAFDNNWHLIGFVWNNSTLTLYIDGVLDSNPTKYSDNSMTNIYNNISLNTNLTIGSVLNNDSPSYLFTGRIDEARLYNAAMTTSQIKKQYYSGLNNLLISGSISKEEYLSRINQTLAKK